MGKISPRSAFRTATGGNPKVDVFVEVGDERINSLKEKKDPGLIISQILLILICSFPVTWTLGIGSNR